MKIITFMLEKKYMNLNKKLMAIIGIVLIIAFVGVGAFMYFGRGTTGELPTVSENQGTQTSTPSSAPTSTPEIDNSNVQLPSLDNEGLDNLITEEETTVDEEALAEHESEISSVPEQTITSEEESSAPVQAIESEPAEENKKIEEPKKEAATKPNVQKPVGEPFEIEEVQPEPKKDENGYIYTKEEAIEIFRTEFQKLIDANDFNYTYARDTAIGEGRSTQEEFEADLKQLLTDPYSSEWLTRAFDYFRQYGHKGILIGEASMWLGVGGDDAEWSESFTQ